jgi:hypothetical protein
MNVFSSNCRFSLRSGRRGRCIWISRLYRRLEREVRTKQGQAAAAVFGSICLLSDMGRRIRLSTSLSCMPLQWSMEGPFCQESARLLIHSTRNRVSVVLTGLCWGSCYTQHFHQFVPGATNAPPLQPVSFSLLVIHRKSLALSIAT